MAAFAAVVPANEPGLSPQASLTTALTIEGLLFAGLALSFRFHASAEGGRKWWSSGKVFGWTITAAILGAAVAAGASWWAVFSPDWPCDINEILRAWPLLLGIIVPPVVAGMATIAGWKTE